MVIVAVTLQSKVHRRLVAIITSVGDPLNLWYGQAAKQCKNSDANSEWLKAQMGGGIMGLCDATLKQLVSPLVVEECGFQSFAQSPPQDLNGMSTIEDDLAETMGHLCLELVAHRMKRLMCFLLGYPLRMTDLLLGDERAQKFLSDFRKHSEAFGHLSSIEDPPRCLREALERSPFQTVAAQQLLHGCKFEGWVVAPALASLACERTKGVISSLIIEDMFNLQKNCKQVRGPRRMRRPERCMGVSLGMQLIGGRHGYGEVKPGVMVGAHKRQRSVWRLGGRRDCRHQGELEHDTTGGLLLAGGGKHREADV